MMNVYAVSSDALPTNVTVAARTADEAFRMFYLWGERYAPNALEGRLQLDTFTAEDLAEQPQLAEAARAGVSGVARWRGHREGWVVSAPDGAETGAIAPPVSRVRAFVFLGDCAFPAIHMFAENIEWAIATMDEVCRSRLGREAEHDLIVEVSPWRLVGEKLTMREEMFAGRTGLGLLCKDGMWHICAPGDEATLADV